MVTIFVSKQASQFCRIVGWGWKILNTKHVQYSDPHCTVGIQHPDVSGFHMVESWLVMEWSRFDTI